MTTPGFQPMAPPAVGRWLAASLLAGALTAAPAAAQQQGQPQQPQQQPQQTGSQQGSAASGTNQREIAVIREVDQQGLRDGWSVEALLDADVIGASGKEIGSAENLLLDEQGRAVALIAQVGGFWDIGDTHVAIPWDEVERGADGLRVPVTEETVDEYSLFRDEYFSKADVGTTQTVDDDLETGPSIWKATSLLNDYAVFETGDGYGYVDDLVMGPDDKLQTVVVDASAAGFSGYYGYPWYGYGYPGYTWSPGLGYYSLPYSSAELASYPYVTLAY